MSNEFSHASVGASMSEAEFVGLTLHKLDGQASGDMIYATSSTQLSRFPRGTNNQFLQTSSALIPEWVSSPTLAGNLDMSAYNLVTDTTSGTKIATTSLQKIGFFGATPTVQLAHVTSTAVASTLAISILNVLESFGFIR